MYPFHLKGYIIGNGHKVLNTNHSFQQKVREIVNFFYSKNNGIIKNCKFPLYGCIESINP